MEGGSRAMPGVQGEKAPYPLNCDGYPLKFAEKERKKEKEKRKKARKKKRRGDVEEEPPPTIFLDSPLGESTSMGRTTMHMPAVGCCFPHYLSTLSIPNC